MINTEIRTVREKTYDETFAAICKNLKVEISDERFVYFIDLQWVMDTTVGYRYENLTPNYEKVIKYGLKELRYSDQECKNKFCNSYNNVIDSLMDLVGRIIYTLNHEKPFNYEIKVEWFEGLLNRAAIGFEESIQRMLFLNQIFWQMDHRLTGLGSWDAFLLESYHNEIKNGTLDKLKAEEIITDLLHTLHRYYPYKSNVLMGDTGQIFVLGRSDMDGNYLDNPLIPTFIKALKKAQIPDPKILLRVNKNTPRELMEISVDCIASGLGSPLFANDDLIIPALIEFGIDEKDAYGYVTSACWEPLIGGKSTSLNNMTVLNYMRALDNLLRRERLGDINNFEQLKELYLKYLKRNLNAIEKVLHMPKFQYNPLLSVFTDDCRETKKDVSHGGARYKNIGITTIALSNTVNSLINIKRLVFEDKELTLNEVKNLLIFNYEEKEDYLQMLKMISNYYGGDEDETIDLVNEITNATSEYTKDFRSYLGGKLKFGLSSPSYIDAGRFFPASFDGRKRGEPFQVHISNEKTEAYTELINFAGMLQYDKNRFNGNVVDFMISPSFIYDNWDKFINFIMHSIEIGFFEMQMNVVSSEILMKAQEDPGAYPNLIVRVWGFSSYFKDLPEEYKKVLIERALKNEGKAS